MKLYHKYIENRFFVKMSLTYCFILVSGILLSAYFITYDMMKDLSETQLKYEREVLQKVEQHTENTIIEISKIIKSLYINSHDNSIIHLISPYKHVTVSQEEKRKLISHTLQNICNANSIITDMMILDHANKVTYFYSNLKSRDISVDYNFFHENQSIFTNASNNKKIIPSHIPEYIIKRNSTSNMPVITIYASLYDLEHINDDKKIGIVAININPEIFFQPFSNEINELKGDIFILKESNMILSTNNKTLEDYIYLQNKEMDQYSNKIDSETIGLTFENFINKDRIYASVRKSREKVIQVIVVSILLGIIVSILSSRVFTGRIKELVNHIKKIEKGGFNTEIKVHNKDEISYLKMSFNEMCKKTIGLCG